MAAMLPSFIRARATRATNWCPNNLRMLDGAKQQWALENRRTKGDNVTWDDIKPYIKTPLICSRGGTYILGRVGELPRCSTGGDHTLPPATDP
jgi:general secretion pathway protein G